MSAKRPEPRRQKPKPAGARPTGAESKLDLRRVAAGVWRLVPSRCALARADDMDEVDAMIAGGEPEIAADELRFLLQECPDFLQAHQTLGQIALEADDFSLSRGHFGHVFDLVRKLWQSHQADGQLPYQFAENQPVHESGKGLAWSLHQLKNDPLARDVVQQLLDWDPLDPLGVRAWLTQWNAPG